MLQTQTVEPRTLEILNELMALPQLSNFLLVGGTALSLQFGHRKSIDLDLFSTEDFDTASIAAVLQKRYPHFISGNIYNPVGLFGFIDDIKTDFVKYHFHPLIGEPFVEDGIRLISNADIVAMKINAVMRRGVKKDFWDIAELLDHYSIDSMIDCFSKKYPGQQLAITVPQAITYFDDAEESENPISLKGQTWEAIKKKIQFHVRAYLA